MEYNIYCDESCHLEHDKQRSMVLGAVWCPASVARDKFSKMREIKARHQLPGREVKWGKVSPVNVGLYQSLIDDFFDDDDLRFRAVIIRDKNRLDHARFSQDHDAWYYKMYFSLLNGILVPGNTFRVFLDIKDTRGGAKVRKLHDVLCNANYDFSAEIVKSIQIVRSQEVELVQLSDILTGALSYHHRSLRTSDAKRQLIDTIRLRSGYTLNNSTLLREDKFNLFCWNPS